MISVKCHKQTFKSLLDHLVGATEPRLRHSDADHPGSMCIDDYTSLIAVRLCSTFSSGFVEASHVLIFIDRPEREFCYGSAP
jgi:hypothetical protein